MLTLFSLLRYSQDHTTSDNRHKSKQWSILGPYGERLLAAKYLNKGNLHSHALSLVKYAHIQTFECLRRCHVTLVFQED